jgi:hypothetical protein
MPRLSVILPAPARQSAQGEPADVTLRRSVRATLAALPRDSRLVVLTGPGTVPALDPDPRLEVRSVPEPLTAPLAVNWLLENTDSELVARADPGDAALPWRFRLALNALGRGADVVFAPVLGAGTTGREFSFSDAHGTMPLGSDALRLHLLLSSPVCAGTIAARRETLSAVGGYREVPMADYDLALRLAVQPVRMHRLGVPGLVSGAAPRSTARSEVRRQPSSEGLVADAFRALSTQLLGREHLRLPVLAALPLSAEELEEELSAFSSDVRGAARSLGLVERYPLLRALRRRIAATRSLHRTEMVSVAW